MGRIPRLLPEQLDERQAAVYDTITDGPRATTGAFPLTNDQGGLVGPFNSMLLHPPLGDALQRLGAALRFQGTLSDRARELAILVVATHARSEFERQAHERVGRQVGLTDAEMAAIRAGTAPPMADAETAAVVRTTSRLLTNRALTDADYAEFVDVLGPARLFELVTLVGYYELLALLMHVFDEDAPR